MDVMRVTLVVACIAYCRGCDMAMEQQPIGERMARVEALQEMQGKQLDRLENKVDGLQKQVWIGAGVVIGAVAVIQIAIALLT